MAKGPTDYPSEGEELLRSNPVSSPRKGARPSAGLPFFDDPELMEWLNPSEEAPPKAAARPKETPPRNDEPSPPSWRREPSPTATNAGKSGRVTFGQRKAALSASEAAAALFGGKDEVAERPGARPREVETNRRALPKPAVAKTAGRPQNREREREQPRPRKPLSRGLSSPIECLRTGWREWKRSRRRRELEQERDRVLAGLAHLEARLGVMEWRRLERKEELRRPMARIQRVERIHERQQERLRFVEGAMRELNREEERLRKKEQVTMERLDDQIANLEERDRHSEKRLADIDAQISRLDDALIELNEEDAMVMANFTDLQLAGIETEEDEERRAEIQERRRQIPRQQASMEQERDDLEMEAERRQREKETVYERLLALEGERRQSARHFNKTQRRLDSRREALRRRCQSTEEAARHLRRQIWEPYQEVGARLADAGVSAALQPYLLGGIRALRAEIEEVERQIADLAKASLAESRLEKVVCLLIWGLLGLGLPLAVGAVIWYLRGGLPALPFVQ